MPRSRTTCCLGAIAGGVIGCCFGWILGWTAFPEFSNSTPELVTLSLMGFGAVWGFAFARWKPGEGVHLRHWDEFDDD